MFSSIFGGGGFGSVVDGGISIYNARQAQKHQEKMYKHRYQWAVEDARKAGLNPILTAQHGPGSAPSAPQADSSARFSEMPGRAAQARLAREQIRSAQTEQARNVASARQHEAQTRYYQEHARSAAIDADQKFLSHQHWLDPQQGSSLSSAKAMTDAGYMPSARSVGGGVFGFADNVRNWFSRDKRDDREQTTARELRPLSKKELDRIRKKSREASGGRKHWIEDVIRNLD